MEWDDVREQGFLRAIEIDPADDVTRLVYADWLEERGEGERAAYLRAEVAFQSALSAPPEPQSLFRQLLRRHVEDPVERARAELEAARDRVENAWAATVARAPVENRSCEASEVRFAFACPLTWEHLVRTDSSTVRECQTCHERVYYCRTVEMAKVVARHGRCVAIDAAAVRRPGDVLPETSEVFMGLLDSSEP